MWVTTGAGPSVYKRLLFLLLHVFVLSCCSGQQCPRQGLTTFSGNGSVTFTPLPPGSDNINPTYDPGPVGGWFNLARGFVDAARPGGLPYSDILRTLNSTGVQCLVGTKSVCRNTEPLNIQRLISSLAQWWVGLLIVTIIGLLLAVIGFCITGLCFCCCRCCGHCGGSKSQHISENMDCKAFTFTIILFLFLLLLLVGVILAFLSNQRSYESVANVQTTLNRVVDIGVGYVNQTVDELDHLSCQLTAENVGVAGRIVYEAQQLNNSLFSLANGLQNQVNGILNNITTAIPGYGTSIEVLANITTTTSNLTSAGATLTASVNRVATDIGSISTDCMSSSLGVCGSLPNANELRTGANFTLLPDVTAQLDMVRQAIESVNLEDAVANGRREFNKIITNVETTIIPNIDDAIRRLQDYNRTASTLVNNVTSTVNGYVGDNPNRSPCPTNFLDSFSSNNLRLNVGYIRRCIINLGFAEIRKYDVIRYALGIVICSLSLVTIVLALIGIVMGMAGFRKDRDPNQRTKLSHCGGIFLMIGVCLTFIFGFVLLIICCIFFFLGANAQKICQSLGGPQYSVFRQVLDNREFWGGSLIGTLIPVPAGSQPAEIYISGILNNCEADMSLFEAANLSVLLPQGNISNTLNNLVNLSQLQEQLDQTLSNAVVDFNFSDSDFLSRNAQNALEMFQNASLTQINITSFRRQIDSPPVAFNLTEVISNLTNINASLQVAADAGSIEAQRIQMNITNVILQLENIRDVQIPSLRPLVDQLERQVDMLVMLINTVVMQTNGVVDSIRTLERNISGNALVDQLVQDVRGLISRLFLYINRYISNVDTQLTSSVGRCRPLWGVYEELHITICRNFIDGLNGFWWSLGFCAILFIPVIIFSVVTSQYYLKKKLEGEEILDGYNDYPLKSY